MMARECTTATASAVFDPIDRRDDRVQRSELRQKDALGEPRS